MDTRIKKSDWELWYDVTFKTTSYRKNFDFINTNENIINEHDGKVARLRLGENKPPEIIGEYSLSVWNIRLGLEFDADVKKLVEEYAKANNEHAYQELLSVWNDCFINAYSFDKLIIVHTLVLRKEYRKHFLSEEFAEMLYRDYYGKNVGIVMLVKPIQYNKTDMNHFYEHGFVTVKDEYYSTEKNIQASDFYSLDELKKEDDQELNEYKLFAVAQRCGFNRIGESYLFSFSPEKIIGRMKYKQEYLKQLKG